MEHEIAAYNVYILLKSIHYWYNDENGFH
jgi:hypothetical protein